MDEYFIKEAMKDEIREELEHELELEKQAKINWGKVGKGALYGGAIGGGIGLAGYLGHRKGQEAGRGEAVPYIRRLAMQNMAMRNYLSRMTQGQGQ